MTRILFESVRKSVIDELDNKIFHIKNVEYDDFTASIKLYHEEEDPIGVVMHELFFIDENSLNQTIKTLF